MATSGEGRAASLTAKGLDLLGTAMLAIPNQSVDVSVGDSKVRALLVGTGEAFGVYPLGCSPAAFHLTPGVHRQRCRLSTRRGSGGQTTGGAVVWGARFEQTVEPGASLGSFSRLGRTMMGPAQGTKQREREQEEEQEHMLVHEESSWFDMRRRDS